MSKVDDLEFGVQIEQHGKYHIVKIHRTILESSFYICFDLNQEELGLTDKQYRKLINYLDSFFDVASNGLNDSIKLKLTRE